MLSTALSAVLALLAGPFHAAPNGIEPDPLPVSLRPALHAPAAGTSQETAEGAEILRRILADALDRTFDDEDEQRGDHLTVRERRGASVNGLVTTLWAGNRTVEQSRVFHMPDVGLFFSMDASLPVVAVEKAAAPEKGKAPATDDEWEQKRREVRGDLSGVDGSFRQLRFVTPPPSQIDPAAIERTIDLVLRTLARHAGRIEGLSAGESVTVALRLGGRGRTLFQDFGVDGFGNWEMLDGVKTRVRADGRGVGDAHDDGNDEGDESESGKAHPTETLSAYVVATGHDVREQSLVIRIALADLTRDESIQRLRQRAQVNLY